METQVYLEAAVDAAREAGQMLKENLNVSREISFKGDVDLVTNFDNQSQKMIYDRLSTHFTDHDFIAEEGLEQEKGGDFCWIFDPLDGTTNYAHRFPIFTVSIALVWKGQVICGVVYDPMRDEMFTGIKGGGAFLNGRQIKVSSINELDKSLVATGFPYDLRESSDNNIAHFSNFLTRVQAIRRCGSAAMDLCYVACGRFDGFWELKLKPWDVAAAALIVEEARGRLSDFRNGLFSIYSQETLGTNGLIHQQMVDVLSLGRRQEAR
ncbi:MAG: inositol monophosphatase [Candidatus Aminicenantes bacterium]|nr:inositol monophosphatase [Candidatus Aminicenantes bacterium]MDH5383714.1 inositol monophosphatase [Candidatus Aminicenantes bacterium]MDH5745143.1 inositol monophosphatase [Candidatus Aminicenantes bacterium]